MIPRGTTFEFEYLGEFEKEIKNISGHESGGHMRLIHEKNPRPKFCATVPLKAFLGEMSTNRCHLSITKVILEFVCWLFWQEALTFSNTNSFYYFTLREQNTWNKFSWCNKSCWCSEGLFSRSIIDWRWLKLSEAAMRTIKIQQTVVKIEGAEHFR